MAVPNNHPLKKHAVFGSQRWLIGGIHYTILSFVGMAKDRGFNTSQRTMISRLNRGETNIEAIIAPPERDRREEHRKRHDKKRDEMAQLLAQMGPAKRY